MSKKGRVYVAYTGGTIGMRYDEDRHTYRPAPGFLAEQLKEIEELRHPTLPEMVLNEYAPLLDSADMAPHNWVGIAEDIIHHYDGYDGFVVLHGTDTMAYTASALSFFLNEGLDKPVILTGSMVPLCQPRNDARGNIITALMIAGSYPIPEVCLYFGGKLLRGNRAMKVHATGFNAFDSPNYPPLGTVGMRINVDYDLLRRPPRRPPEVGFQPLADSFVGALRIFPGITGTLMRNVLRTPLDALVLEAYGVGNGPATLNKDFVAALSEATARGVVIVDCSQCLTGTVDLTGYETGSVLAEAGVVSGYDMTTEAALTKLSYLFSCGYSVGRIREEMQRSLRGELTAPVFR